MVVWLTIAEAVIKASTTRCLALSLARNNLQFCMLEFEGALCANLKVDAIISCGTGSGRNARTE